MEMTLIGPHRCPYTENLFFYIIKQENRSDSVVLPLFFFFFFFNENIKIELFIAPASHTNTEERGGDIFVNMRAGKGSIDLSKTISSKGSL
jgi:hypothetical protein